MVDADGNLVNGSVSDGGGLAGSSDGGVVGDSVGDEGGPVDDSNGEGLVDLSWCASIGEPSLTTPNFLGESLPVACR